MLLYALRHQTRLAFRYYDGREDANQRDVDILKNLFYLNAHADPSLLDRLNIQGIRKFCQHENADDNQVILDTLHNYVLLADELVLKDVFKREFIVKAVSLNWV